MHVQDKRAYVHYERVLSLMSRAQCYCSEVDLREMALNMSPEDMMMPDDTSLQEVLGAHRFKKATTIVKKAFGLDILSFDRWLPMLFINQMTVAVLEQDFKKPLDMSLWDRAEAMGLELGGLETISDQKRILKSLDLNHQIRMLKGILKDVKAFRRQTLKTVNLFVEGELHELYQRSKRDLGPLKAVLIYSRNYTMCRSFQERHKSGPCVAAVGGGHFAGKHGLVTLLRQAGMTVRPLNFR